MERKYFQTGFWPGPSLFRRLLFKGGRRARAETCHRAFALITSGFRRLENVYLLFRRRIRGKTVALRQPLDSFRTL